MKPLREGFTTGSCAAAAALASCLWQRDGESPSVVEIVVPEGRVFRAEIIPRGYPCCGVIKDAGDDPDITHGQEVRAQVSLDDADGPIRFRAGDGVGVITRPGLKCAPGQPAINPVPRRMIEDAVRSVYGDRSAEVTVSIPAGAELARRTFNPRLGIQGGLSVLGTSGIVRPMSEDAITESIALEMEMRRAQGVRALGLTFGSQGEAALLKAIPAMRERIIQMSNYVGFTLDRALELRFKRLLIAGHPGKLVKLAAGVMQTHSSVADARREPVMAHLARMGANAALIERIYLAATTDAMIAMIAETGMMAVWDALADAAAEYCMARVRGALPVDVMFQDGDGAIIGRSEALRSRDGNLRWEGTRA